ncbi:MAG: hypothetical protein ACXV7J_03005 [Methylomonas sp.]
MPASVDSQRFWRTLKVESSSDAVVVAASICNLPCADKPTGTGVLVDFHLILSFRFWQSMSFNHCPSLSVSGRAIKEANITGNLIKPLRAFLECPMLFIEIRHIDFDIYHFTGYKTFSIICSGHKPYR